MNFLESKDIFDNKIENNIKVTNFCDKLKDE